MGVAAVNVGRQDLAAGLPFVEALGRDGLPWVSANLRRKGGEAPFPRWRVLPWGDKAKVAVIGLLRPDASRDSHLGIDVVEPAEAVATVLGELPPVDAVVCLSNLGLVQEIELAKRVPGLAVIVGGGSSELLTEPRIAGQSVILHVSDRGKYLGVLDLPSGALGRAWKSPRDLGERAVLEARVAGAQAEIAALGGGTEAQVVARAGPDGAKARRAQAAFRTLATSQQGLAELEKSTAVFSHRIVTLASSVPDDPEMASWVKGYKDFERGWSQRNAGATSPERATPVRSPSGAPFHVGSAACRDCHPDAYRSWLSTRHARAYLSLRGREQQPGCTECHASTLQRVSGPLMEPAVACEACHGPGGNHRGRGNVARKPPEPLCLRCHKGFHKEQKFDYRRDYERVRCERRE